MQFLSSFNQLRQWGVAMALAATVSVVSGQSSVLLAQAADDASGLEGNATFQEGRQLYEDGNIGKALPLLKQLLQEHPNNSQAHLWLAKALMKQGGNDNFQLAKTHLIKSLTINPNEGESLMYLGRIVGWDASRRGQAIELHERALALKDTSPVVADHEIEITRNLVQLLMWDGEYVRAAEYAQPVRSAFATEKKWQAVYANLLSHLGQAKDALPLYEEYIKPFDSELTTESAQWQLDYIYALRFGDQPQKAHSLYEQVASNVKQLNEPGLNAQLASVAYELGQYDNSIELTNSLPPELGQTKDARLRNARAYMKIQEAQSAIDTFYQVYQTGEMTPSEKLELADIIIGQQLTSNMLPQADLVDVLYGEVANNRTAMENPDLQLRVARYQAGQSATAAPDGTVTADDVSPQVFQAYLTAMEQAGSNYQAPLDELLGYLKSRKGPETQSSFQQLLSEYPSNMQVKGAYAEYLSWDELTRTEAVDQLVQLAETDRDGQKKWLNKLDEIMGWGNPNPEWMPLYDRILAVDPDHIGAYQAKRQLMTQAMPEPNIQRAEQSQVPQSVMSQPTQAVDPWEQGYQTRDTSMSSKTQQSSAAATPPLKPATPHQSDMWGGSQQKTLNRSVRQAPTEQRWADWTGSPQANSNDIRMGSSPYQYDKPYGAETNAVDMETPQEEMASSTNAPLTYTPTESIKPYRPQQKAPAVTSEPTDLKQQIEEAKQLSYDRKYRQSFRLFDRVLAQDSGNKDALLGKAYALLWSGRKYQAKKILSNLHYAYPQDIEITTALADAYKSMGRNDKVIELMREIRSFRGFSDDAMTPGFATLGFVPCANVEQAPQNNLSKIVIKGVAISSSDIVSDVSLNDLPDVVEHQNVVRLAEAGSSDVDALQDELDSLNAALATLENVQAESDQKIDALTEDLWNTRQPFETSATEFQDSTPQPSVNTQDFLAPRYAQTATVYGNPTGGNYTYIPPSQQYLYDNIDRIEGDLYDDLRPEFRIGYGYQTQGGDENLNKYSTWGILNQVSFNLLPQLRVRGGVIPQNFYLPQARISPDSNFGMLYTIGATAKPFDRVTLDGDFGIARFSQSDKTNVNYRARLTLDPWDRVRFHIGSRRLTLANSLLSIAGFKPKTGAFNGDQLGPAVETSIFTELNLTPFQNVDLNLGYEFAHVDAGDNSPASYKNQVLASLGYTQRFNDKHWARIGYQFMWMNFTRNTINGYFDVTSFGATSPVVGLNPVTLAQNGYDFGGYFSPKNFFLNAIRLDYRGSLFERFLEYKIGGSMGIQSYSHGHGITDSSPTSLATSADAAIRLNFTDWLSMYGRFGYLDSGGAFTRYRMEGGLILRPYIEALSPVIGEKVPKSDNFRKVDSQFPFRYDIYNHYY